MHIFITEYCRTLIDSMQPDPFLWYSSWELFVELCVEFFSPTQKLDNSPSPMTKVLGRPTCMDSSAIRGREPFQKMAKLFPP